MNKQVDYFSRLKAQRLRLLQRAMDASTIALAFTVAYLLRLDFQIESHDWKRILTQLPIVVVWQVVVLKVTGVNSFIWRYTGWRDVKRIVIATVSAAVPLLAVRFFAPESLEILRIPISIIILHTMLAALGLIALRMLRRELHDLSGNARRTATSATRTKVLLVGAGRIGLLTIDEIRRNRDVAYEVVGFVDDDPKKIGATVSGLRVLGNRHDLPRLVDEHQIGELILTLADAPREDFKQILKICRSLPVRLKTVPRVGDLISGKINASRIRDVEVADLLGRPAVELDLGEMRRFISGKVVMITGAGGSIGSELVRQISDIGAAEILLVDRSEFGLFQITQEMTASGRTNRFRTLIADVTDATRIETIFRRYRPAVVFHAAAHKHVPMMEENVCEAVKNNVLGTQTVARLAGESGVESFVLISTDKAVHPTSIMGATKRCAELVIQHLNQRYETNFSAVRFGNVIGSNGSVIPTFREQIRRGGPVTVTHPEMTRYFMTIPEATQLVIQAGAFGDGGELFILDMGEPVRILDLALETIRLSGLEPEKDMKIEFTGIRPGEKLHEELESDAERLMPTAHGKIYIAQISAMNRPKFEEMIGRLTDAATRDDETTIRTVFCESLAGNRIRRATSTESESTPLHLPARTQTAG